MNKRAWWLATLLTASLWMLWPTQSVEAYWGYRDWQYGHGSTYQFRPRFALSLTGGFHFVDTYVNPRNHYDDFSPAFSFGMVELGGHLWVHPNISIDLAVAGHFAFNDLTGAEWGYVSVKPGMRVRFGWFYLRTAVDLAFSEAPDRSTARRRPVLFGLLFGVGVRIPVSRIVRIIGELDYQVYFSDLYYMPFYGKVGLEFVF